MVSAFLSTLFGKLAAGGLALAIVASGAAATGSLPDAAQQHVSDALAKAGIHVPAPDQLAGDADAEGENESNVSHEPAGPVLPESASDTAKSVTATVFGSELTGRAFGEAVAAAAKGRASREATRAVPTISAAPAVQEKPTVPAIPTTPSIPPDPR